MKRILFVFMLCSMALYADSTVVQPITYAAPVSITINLTPNEPVSLPLMRDTRHMKITIPEGQRISVDGAEVRGVYESQDQIRLVTVFDADRVTINVEESK